MNTSSASLQLTFFPVSDSHYLTEGLQISFPVRLSLRFEIILSCCPHNRHRHRRLRRRRRRGSCRFEVPPRISKSFSLLQFVAVCCRDDLAFSIHPYIQPG